MEQSGNKVLTVKNQSAESRYFAFSLSLTSHELCCQHIPGKHCWLSLICRHSHGITTKDRQTPPTSDDTQTFSKAPGRPTGGKNLLTILIAPQLAEAVRAA